MYMEELKVCANNVRNVASACNKYMSFNSINHFLKFVSMEAFTTFPFHFMEVWMSSKEEKKLTFFCCCCFFDFLFCQEIFTESEIFFFIFYFTYIYSVCLILKVIGTYSLSSFFKKKKIMYYMCNNIVVLPAIAIV